MNIILGGDYYVSNNKEVPIISDEIQNLFLSVDSAIINFEGPVSTPHSIKNLKTGPNLAQNPESIPYLSKTGITAVTVANNHFYDFGDLALKNTLNNLKNNNISCLGYKEAKKSKELIVEKDDLKIAVLAYAEEEWCGPSDLDISIALIDDIDISRDILQLRNKVDGVVILLHANNEYNNLPSPYLVKKCRFYIEQGACAVLLHHAHVVSGFEVWQDYPIFYGLGNFQFTMQSANPEWYEGLLVNLEFIKTQDNLKVNFSLYPTVMSQINYSVDLASVNQSYQIINQINNNSSIIISEKSLEAGYQQFLLSKQVMYYEMLNPFYDKNKLMRFIGRIMVKSFFLKGNSKRMLLNVLRCFSHRRAMIEIIQKLIYTGK